MQSNEERKEIDDTPLSNEKIEDIKKTLEQNFKNKLEIASLKKQILEKESKNKAEKKKIGDFLAEKNYKTFPVKGVCRLTMSEMDGALKIKDGEKLNFLNHVGEIRAYDSSFIGIKLDLLEKANEGLYNEVIDFILEKVLEKYTLEMSPERKEALLSCFHFTSEGLKVYHSELERHLERGNKWVKVSLTKA